MTGSGKTTLAKYLLSERKYVIAIDTKHENKWPGFKITHKIEECFKDTGENEAKHIFRPDSSRLFEPLFYRIYQEGGWHVYIDEIYQLGRGTITSFPYFYIRDLTAGRSRNVTVWTATQRPKFLPLFAMTEATHLFVFELGSGEDRKHLMRLAGVEGIDQKVEKHAFIYYNRATKRLTKERLKI